MTLVDSGADIWNIHFIHEILELDPDTKGMIERMRQAEALRVIRALHRGLGS